MFKKIIFISLIIFFAGTGEIFAYATYATAELDQAAAFIGEDQLDQARTLYNSLLADPPDNETEILARGGLIVIDILQGDMTTAKTSADALIADYSSNEIISAAAYEIAYVFFNAGEPDEARQYFQYVIDNWPDSEDGLSARFGVIRSNIRVGKIQEAENELKNLLSNLPAGEDFSGQLNDTADAYREAGEYDSAQELYQNVIETWPDSKEAIFAKFGVIRCNIRTGNTQEAGTALSQLLSNLPAGEDFSGQLKDIADCYRNAGKYNRARTLYQYILDNWPDSEEVMFSQSGLARLNIALGDDPNAQAGIDSLIADFNDHPGLPQAISDIEEGYYNKIWATVERPLDESYHKEPIKVWEKVMEKFPDFFYNDPDLYYFIACCYYQLGEYENAIDYYRKTAANWSNYYQAWGTLSLIESSYEGLKEAGAIGQTEASTQIEQIYNEIIENSPKSTSAKYACLKLGRKYFDSQRWADAAFYFALVWQSFPDDSCLTQVVYDLGWAYEQMGETAIAMETYEEFLKDHPADVRIKARLEELKAANE